MTDRNGQGPNWQGVEEELGRIEGRGNNNQDIL